MTTQTPPPVAEDDREAAGDGGLTQAARTLLTALQWIMLGDEAMPDPDSMTEIYKALAAARAQGRREEREHIRELVYFEPTTSNDPVEDAAQSSFRDLLLHRIDALATPDPQEKG